MLGTSQRYVGRHVRPVAGRRRALTALVGAVGLVGAGLTAALPAAAAITDACSGNWTPVVRSVTVTQGVGNAATSGSGITLTRGKATVVRPFISAPLCAPVGSEQLQSATVTAYDGSTVVGTASTPSTFGPTYPTLDAYALGANNTSSGSPVVRIPALGANSPTAATSGFVTTVKLTLKYSYQAVVGAAPTVVTQDLGQIATAAVSPTAHPLRVLVVPIGDLSAGIDVATAMKTQFPEAKNFGTAVGSPNPQFADTAVQNGLQTLSRLLPVADGVADLTSRTGGLRFRIDDANLLDIGPKGLNLMSTDASGNRYFCGDALKFVSPSGGPSLSSKLAATLNAWNSKNATAQADRILGVVWQGISRGTSDGCDEGYAVIGGQQAYSRVVVDTTVTTSGSAVQDPSMTGSLMGMELGHTLGAVPLADPRDVYSDYHSKNIAADPGNSGQTYNTTIPQWMSSPMSDFRYSGSSSGYTKPSTGTASPWNDLTSLAEQADYTYEQCQLTPGLPAASCLYGAVAGSVGGAPSGPSLSLAGNTDGTPAGTDIHSYYADPVEQTAPAPPPTTGPDYRLIQRDANGLAIHTCTGTSGCVDLGDQRVRVSYLASEHDGLTALSTAPLQFGSVTGSFPVAPGAAAFEVWKGPPPAGSASCTPGAMPAGCIYARLAGTAPQIASISGGAQLTGLTNFTDVAGDETRPALSADGGLLAWVNGGSIYVQRRDPATNLPTGPKSAGVAGTDPSWSKTGALTIAIATAAGDIDTATVTPGSGTTPPTIGATTRVYDHLLQPTPILGSRNASHPSFSPDGLFLALQINGGIWRVNAAGATTNPVTCDLATLNITSTCRPLVTDGNDSAPAWSPTRSIGGALIAYNRGADLWSLDPNASGYAPTLRIAGAQLPSWSGDLASYVTAGNIWVADSTRENATTRQWTSLTQLTAAGTDTAAALAARAGAIAFDRTTPATGHDVFDATVGSGNPAITFTATTTGDPTLLRSDLYIFCAGAYDPIGVALRPTSTTTGATFSTASFSFDYDDRQACPGGTIYAQVTNGFLNSELRPIRTVPGTPTPPAPSPAIGSPKPGSLFLQYDVIPATGSNTDTSGGTNNDAYSVSWYLTGPEGSGYSSTAVGTGARVDIAPPAGGWKAGPYTLTQKVTGAAGQTASTSTTYAVLADPTHGDLNVTVSFNPSTLYVPSNGNDVKVVVTPQQGQDLSQISASTVRIVQVGRTATAQGVDTASGTTGWYANGNGSYTAKFDRQTLTCVMTNTGLVGGYILVVVSGSGGGQSFRGFDPVNPNTSQADPPVPC